MAEPRKLGPKDKQEILRRAQAGESYVSIARDYGVTPTAIGYHMRTQLPSRLLPKLTKPQIQRAVQRWKKGETVAELARDYGVGHTTMTKHITRVTRQPIGRARRAPLLRLPTKSEELAYLAGIVDGEGCISFRQDSGSWTVAVTNTSVELETLLRGIGGLFYYPARRASFKLDGTFTKQRFEWKISRAWDVCRLLEALLPYLVIKRERAEQAIQKIRGKFGAPPVIG